MHVCIGFSRALGGRHVSIDSRAHVDSLARETRRRENMRNDREKSPFGYRPCWERYACFRHSLPLMMLPKVPWLLFPLQKVNGADREQKTFARTRCWHLFFTYNLAAGICTSDGRTTREMCQNALRNSTVIMGYGEELRRGVWMIGSISFTLAPRRRWWC